MRLEIEHLSRHIVIHLSWGFASKDGEVDIKQAVNNFYPSITYLVFHMPSSGLSAVYFIYI